MQWTAGQQAAIEARNDSVLVSAAAGSGKTAVLVERVLSLLREGKRIDRMLIVTFTRAAAGEMRERARPPAGGGRGGGRAPAPPGHAPFPGRPSARCMCSAPGCCGSILRPWGWDPLFKIADEERLRPLRQRALDETLEAAYAAPSEEERQLFAQFEDQQIAELMQQCHHFLLAQADPWGFAQARTGQAAESLARWTPLLERLCADQLEGAAELLPALEQILHQGDGPGPLRPRPGIRSGADGAIAPGREGGKAAGRGNRLRPAEHQRRRGRRKAPKAPRGLRPCGRNGKSGCSSPAICCPDEARAEADLRRALRFGRCFR